MRKCFQCPSIDSCLNPGGNRIGAEMEEEIYHEKQVKELCCLHALNNLFQERGGAFGQDSLDALAHSLSPSAWLNPHKSILGTGNYDVNVLMAALRTRGSHALWFDKRKDVGLLNLGNILGFILNVPSEYRLGGVLPLPLHRRHWVAIRAIGSTYYNLDSKLRAPEPIGEESDLLAYLRDQLHSKEKELFVVVSDEVEQSHSWLNSSGESGGVDEGVREGDYCRGGAEEEGGDFKGQTRPGREVPLLLNGCCLSQRLLPLTAVCVCHASASIFSSKVPIFAFFHGYEVQEGQYIC